MISLFPHQQEALQETKDFDNIAVYHDMGLGKTFTGSEMMKRFGCKVNLIVCQKSKVQDWVEHFTDNYQMQVFDLKGVMLTDEAQMSGYGNPMGTATNQIAMSISEKLDNDRVNVLIESKNIYDATAGAISYNAIVEGVDVFGEEEDSKKVILIHSKQKTQLRKDPDFIDKNKYSDGVMVSGAIGKIAGCDVVVSNKVPKFDTWYKMGGSTKVTSSNIAEVKKSLPFVKENDMVTAVSTPAYFNPIIKLDNDAETEDDMSAITYFLKKGNLVEHERHIGVGDEIVCTAHGMPALTNEAKVVILKTAVTPTA